MRKRLGHYSRDSVPKRNNLVACLFQATLLSILPHPTPSLPGHRTQPGLLTCVLCNSAYPCIFDFTQACLSALLRMGHQGTSHSYRICDLPTSEVQLCKASLSSFSLGTLTPILVMLNKSKYTRYHRQIWSS